MALKTVELIRTRLAARPAELEAARAAGAKVVGWLNYNVPEEIIHALGLIPIRLGSGADERVVELGGRFISTGTCVYVRHTTGLFAEKKDPYVKSADLVVADATCKQVFRLAEVVKHYFKVNTHVLGVPYNFAEPAGKTYFRKEVQALTHYLEKFAGSKLEQEKLDASVRLFGEIRQSLRALYQHQKKPNPAIRWREAYEVVQAGNYLDKAEYLELLELLLAELATSKRVAYGSEWDDAPRLLLSGSIIPPGDHKLLDIIEQLGGRIVVDDLWSGFAQALTVQVEDASIEAIADAHLIPHASLPTLDFEGDQRLKNLKSLVREYGAEGIVYHTLRYCDAFTFKANETKRVFIDAGTPFLEIHTEYSGSDYEAIRTRIEAFVEMVKARTPVLTAA